MNRQILIRSANDGDSADLASLSAQLGYPISTEEARDRLKAIQSSGDEILVALSDAKVVGWAGVTILRTLEGGVKAELTGLVVDESMRGQGLGARLVQAAEQWAEKHGVKKMRVRSNVKREDAHRFYLREGYSIAKTQLIFEKVAPDDSKAP